MKRLAAALFLVGCLGGATEAYAAEAPPTVSVEGVGSVAISQTATQAQADSAYRQGLAAAIGDGHEKAEFLAVTTAAKLGAIDQIVERGGEIDCVLHAEAGPAFDYEPYNGAQPDFGSVESNVSRVAAPEAARTVSVVTSHPKKKKKEKRKKKPTGKKAAVLPVSCTLSTQVVLAYLLM